MRVGITGSYASGKGTVCSMLVNRGAVEVDTDIIAREIMEPGSPVLEKIKEVFGSSCFVHGTLDRAAFARYVFSDEERTKELNKITHPAILKKTMEKTSGSELYVVNVPLLFESGFDQYMDTTVLVFCSVEQSIERGMQRDGLEREEIILRLKRQMELNEKRERADHEIDNSYGMDHTEKQVRELWNILNRRNQE